MVAMEEEEEDVDCGADGVEAAFRRIITLQLWRGPDSHVKKFFFENFF